MLHRKANTPAPTQKGTSALRVLLLDGEPLRAEAVRLGIEAAGCTVVAIAPDVAELTERVHASQADVLVWDWNRDCPDLVEGLWTWELRVGFCRLHAGFVGHGRTVARGRV
jgi:AmiR/NasT family two-component response regulator